MSSNFWDDDAKPVIKAAAPKAAPKQESFWDDDAPAAKGSFWDDEDAPQGQTMTMARGAERREVDANPAAMHEAEAEGFNTPEAQENLSAYKPRTTASPLMAGARALTSSATMGFDDEASGLVGGAVGGVQGKGFVSSYKNSRDRARAENEAATKDQPMASLAGSFIGGAAVPGFAALKAGRIGGAIANGAITGGVMGGVQGLGDSKDITDVKGTATDMALGAGKGAALGGIVGAGAHAATNLGDAKAIPGYMKAMIKGAGQGAAVGWPLPDLQSIAIPIGAIRGAIKHYKANGQKMAEEAVEKSVTSPKIKIGNPPGNKIVEGAQAFGSKALEAGKKYAVNRGIRVGTDQAYNTATGTEEGLPDPIRDQSVDYLQKKMGLSDSQAAAMKKVIPSVYDLAGRGGRGVSKAYDNHVRKSGDYKAQEPSGKLVMDREINHNGKKLIHEIYRDGSEIQHYLVDETGKRVADIKGKMHEYKGDTGLAIHWGGSSTKGQGHGKRLYDLVLDTHSKVFSDSSLSPNGSRRIYEEHYAYSPGVRVDFDTRGTPDRFKVNLKNPDRFRTEKGIDPWSMDHEGNLKDVNAMPDGYRPRHNDEPRYDPANDSNLAVANERAVADFMARIRRGEDSNAARNAVADAHPGASAYAIGRAYRNYRESLAEKSQPVVEDVNTRAIARMNELIRGGTSPRDAMHQASRENQDASHYQLSQAFGRHKDRIENPPSLNSRDRQRVESETRTILAAGGTHQDAKDHLANRFGLRSENVRNAVKGVESNSANSPAGEAPMQLSDSTNKIIRETSDIMFHDGSSVDDVIAHLGERYGSNARTPGIRRAVEDAHSRYQKTPNGRNIRQGTDEELKAFLNDRDDPAFKDTDIPFKNEDMAAQKREQFDELNERGDDTRSNPQHAIERVNMGFGLQDSDLYDVYRVVEQIGHSDPRLVVQGKDALIKAGNSDPELRQHIADWAQGRIKEDVNAREWQAVLNGIGGAPNQASKPPTRTGRDYEKENKWETPAERAREQEEQRRGAEFKAERLRSRMHAAGSEAPRGITIEDQVRRVQAERKARRKAEESESLRYIVDRPEPPPAPRALRIAPSEAEMKALLKKKKDKK